MERSRAGQMGTWGTLAVSDSREEATGGRKGLKVTLSGLYFSGPLAIRGAFSTEIPAAPTHNYLSFLLAFACAG